MRLQRIDAGLFWFGDSVRSEARNALAGPFENRSLAYWWLIEKSEAKLTETQRALWDECLTICGGAAADVLHLLGIVGLVAHNRPAEYCRLASQRIRPDWRPYNGR